MPKNESDDEKDVEKPLVAKTAVDLQRLKLLKLMKNPEKPVIIPERPKSKNTPAVPEFVRNVMGSSAGAGSGEFHVYRHLRRKEYARQKFIQEKGQKELLDEEYHKKLEENKKLADEITAKKRAKRLKRKQKLRGKKFKSSDKPKIKNDNVSEESDSNNSTSDEEKNSNNLDKTKKVEHLKVKIEAETSNVNEVKTHDCEKQTVVDEISQNESNKIIDEDNNSSHEAINQGTKSESVNNLSNNDNEKNTEEEKIMDNN